MEFLPRHSMNEAMEGLCNDSKKSAIGHKEERVSRSKKKKKKIFSR